MNYHEFLLFATRRLKLKFTVVEFCMRGFLRKYDLAPRVIEAYLLQNKIKNLVKVAKKLKVNEKTIRRDLKKLNLVCPELFATDIKIPEIPLMYFPNKNEWEEIERLNQIREKF